MKRILDFLVLPAEISDFERRYLERVNRAALVFFALHVPVFALVAFVNATRPLVAVLLTTAVLLGPVLARHAVKSPRGLSVIYGITAMFMGGLLVHFGQGPVQIEMHFYFFALVAMCAVFGNPLVIVAAAVTVALHHGIVWLVLPKSVFNYQAEWWVVAVHAVFVVLESVATCFIARSFFDNVIGLERIVQARTQELDAKNRDMRLLLDNVQQGFLTIDRGGRLARERSAIVDAWFGTPPASTSWFDYLTTLSPAFAEATRVAWNEVVEDVMPLAVTLEQMPHALSRSGVHYRLEYRPIGTAEPHDDFLVIVTDVTTEVERQRAELARNETMALFERVLDDRAGVQSFFEEASEILHVLLEQRPDDASVVKRLIHTLKGNAACFALTSVAEQCHKLEDFIAETGALPARAAYEPLEARWRQLATELEALLGNRSRSVEIDQEQYEALEAAARAGEAGPALLRRVRGLKLEATGKRLKHFGEQAKRIAERLDKNDLAVEVEDHGVRLDHRRWGGFWGAFIHAVRNAVDHGIEPVEERVAVGKARHGTLVLRTLEEKERLIVEIVDDGRGIDWKRVEERAARAGLSVGTAAELERALFVDGISTAASVTDVSGRGVGMGALLAATQELGGTLEVKTGRDRGTTLRFAFPSLAMRSVESVRPARAFN